MEEGGGLVKMEVRIMIQAALGQQWGRTQESINTKKTNALFNEKL